MKALLIQINGEPHCLAGLPNGGLATSVSWSRDDSLYALSVFGSDEVTRQVAIWPGAEIDVGDEVKITVVEVHRVDEPELSSNQETVE